MACQGLSQGKINQPRSYVMGARAKLRERASCRVDAGSCVWSEWQQKCCCEYSLGLCGIGRGHTPSINLRKRGGGLPVQKKDSGGARIVSEARVVLFVEGGGTWARKGKVRRGYMQSVSRAIMRTCSVYIGSMMQNAEVWH